MKKAEEYLKEVNSFTTRKRLYEIGKQMQIDAIYTAVKRCAKNAKLTLLAQNKAFLKENHITKDIDGYQIELFVNKNSIFDCAEELKKELE